MQFKSLIIIFGCFAFFSACSQGNQETESAVSEEGLTTVTLQVSGMTWFGWVSNVRTALEGLDGISKAEVSLEEGTAVISYDKEKVNENQMVEAVSNADPMFKALVVQ